MACLSLLRGGGSHRTMISTVRCNIGCTSPKAGLGVPCCIQDGAQRCPAQHQMVAARGPRIHHARTCHEAATPTCPTPRPDNGRSASATSTNWVASGTEVDMSVAPPPGPAGARWPRRRRTWWAGPAPHRDRRRRHAERLLRPGRLGGLPRRRQRGRSRADRAAAGRWCRNCARQGVPVVWVNWGKRPDLANMPPEPDPPVTNERRRRRARRGDARNGGRVLREGSWAAADGRRTGAGAGRTSCRQASLQRLLGHRAGQHPAQPGGGARCSLPAATPTSACCVPSTTRASSATAA